MLTDLLNGLAAYEFAKGEKNETGNIGSGCHDPPSRMQHVPAGSTAAATSPASRNGAPAATPADDDHVRRRNHHSGNCDLPCSSAPASAPTG